MTYKIDSIHVGDKFFRVYKQIDFEKKEQDTEFRIYEVSGVFNRSIDLREITPAGRKKTAFRVFLKKGIFEKYDGIYYREDAIMIGLHEWVKTIVKPPKIRCYPDLSDIQTLQYRVNNALISATEWNGSVVFTNNHKQLTGEYWSVFDLIKGIKESENWQIND